MKINKSVLLVCISASLTVGNAFAAGTDQMGTVVSTSSQQTLPPGNTAKKKASKFSPPGSFTMSSERYCGDSDVSNYSSNNPTVTFMEGDATSINAVVGLWVAPTTGSQIPVSAAGATNTWLSIGNATVTVSDESGPFPATDNLRVANKTQVIKTAQAFSEAVAGVIDQAKDAYQMTSNPTKAYNIYAAVHLCKDLVDSTGANAPSNTPSRVEVTKGLVQFSGSAVSVTETAGASGAPSTYTAPSSFALSYDEPNATINVALGSGTSVASDALYTLGMNVLNSVDLTGVTRTKLNAIKDALNTGANCAAVPDVGEQGRWFEPYPMQLTCKVLDGIRSKDVTDLSPAGKKADREFIGKALLTAAFMKNAQNTAHTQFRAAKARCFDDSMKYFHKLVAAITIPISTDPTAFKLKVTRPNDMVHPESGFALSDYMYYDADDNKSVFGMNQYSSTVDPIALGLGATFTPGAVPSPRTVSYPIADMESLKKSPLGIHFAIRSLGCNQNWFCMNK